LRLPLTILYNPLAMDEVNWSAPVEVRKSGSDEMYIPVRTNFSGLSGRTFDAAEYGNNVRRRDQLTLINKFVRSSDT